MSTLCFSCAHIQGSCADILSCTYIVHTLTQVKVNFWQILHFLFLLLLFQNIKISAACAMGVQLWQHPGSINTDCMRTKRKAPAVVFACSGYTRAVEGSIWTKSQGRPTGEYTGKQHGNTARMQCERMTWVVRDACKNTGMHACRYNAGKHVCAYKLSLMCTFASCTRTFRPHHILAISPCPWPIWQRRQMDKMRWEWLDTRECMHRSRRNDQPDWKENKKTATSRRWGGKRVGIHSGERYVLKVTQESKLTQLQQAWRMGSVVGVKSQRERWKADQDMTHHTTQDSHFLLVPSTDKQTLARKQYTRACLGSDIEGRGRKSWNLTGSTDTQDRFKVRNMSRIWHRIIQTLSMRWGTTN